MNLKHWFYMGIMLTGITVYMGCSDDEAEKIPEIQPASIPITVSTSSFTAGSVIPEKYCFNLNGHTGENVSPQLNWKGSPTNTVSFVLLMDDQYAPGSYYSHWILFNIPASITNLPEGYNTNVTAGLQGHVDSGAYNYEGPYPPSGHHTYRFRIYALDSMLTITTNAATRAGLLTAISGHILSHGELTGTHDGH